MFTGIVEETGIVSSISQNASSLFLKIKCSFANELENGESVAVNGTCLTVVSKSNSHFCADVTPETFRRTSLSSLSAGSTVNLERAMKADGRFGGHIVSGHIDGTGSLLSFITEDNAINVSICVNSNLGKYIIEKGSVCIDGISLTVAHVEHNIENTIFSVAVIPHTWNNTTLCKKNNGSILNIECDVVGKYIEHFLSWNCKQDQNKQNLDSFMTDFPSFH